MDEGPLPEVAAYLIIKPRRPVELDLNSDSGGEAASSQPANPSESFTSSQGVSCELSTAHSDPEAVETSSSATMATATTPASTASGSEAAESAPVRQAAVLNRTNSERLGQKPNQRKIFQEVVTISEEDRRVTETVLSENTEFETTLGLEEYSMNRGQSLLESVKHHRDSRSAHVRHHEEVSSVDIVRRCVEHVYRSNFRLPDSSTVAVTHQEVYHTTDPNVEVTVCLAQSLPSLDCPPSSSNVAELAERQSNKWASLILSCDGFRDDQLCSMLLKKKGEKGAEAAADAAAIASSVANVVSLATADKTEQIMQPATQPVVDVSLSSEITYPLPNAYVAMYGEDENAGSESSSAESVVENVATSAGRPNNATPSSKRASTDQSTTNPKSSNSASMPKQEAEQNTIVLPTLSSKSTLKQASQQERLSNEHADVHALPETASASPQSIQNAPKSNDHLEEPPKTSRNERKSRENKNTRPRPSRSATKSEDSVKDPDSTHEVKDSVDDSLQKRMEAFLDRKKQKGQELKLEQSELKISTMESKQVTVTEEIVASSESVTIFHAPRQAARLSVSEKMCMEVLAEPFDADSSDSEDENPTRPRGSYSYLCDGPKGRPAEMEDSVKIFKRVVSNERRLTRGEILTVEFNAGNAKNSSVTSAGAEDSERGENNDDDSRYHVVFVRDPATNSYVKVHEPVYDDVSPKGSKAPSESSSGPGSVVDQPTTDNLRNTPSQYLENPLSPPLSIQQPHGSDEVDMRIWYKTTHTPSSTESKTVTTTSKQVTQLSVVTTQDSDSVEEKFSPGIVKRRAEQFEVRRAIRGHTAEERKSYQELINSGIVKEKRKEHEELIEKDAMPPSPSDFRLEVDADQLERVVFHKEQASVTTSGPVTSSSPKAASVVAPIVRMMETEAVLEKQPVLSSFDHRSASLKSSPEKIRPDPDTDELLPSKNATTQNLSVRMAKGSGVKYPAQDNRADIVPSKRPPAETAPVTEEKQPFSPASIESEATIRYDRSQENLWYSLSASDREKYTNEMLAKAQAEEEPGSSLTAELIGRSETLRFDRAQENLLPSTAFDKSLRVDRLKGDNLPKAEYKISSSERFESKSLPQTSIVTSSMSGTSEDSSPSSAESDGGGDYDTGYEEQYDLQKVLKSVKPKPPNVQHHQPHTHELLSTNLTSLTEADDERESEGDTNSEGGSQACNDNDSLNDHLLFAPAGDSDKQPPISILITDENAINSLLIDDASESVSSSASDQDDDDNYSNPVEWYKPSDDLYLPRRYTLETIDEETVTQVSSAIPQSGSNDATVSIRQSDLSNHETVLVRPPSQSNGKTHEVPRAEEERGFTGSVAADIEEAATKMASTKISLEADEDFDIRIAGSSQYRSASKTQVTNVAQTNTQLFREQESHISTTRDTTHESHVSTASTSLLGYSVQGNASILSKPDPQHTEALMALAETEVEKKKKQKKEHRRSKDRHSSRPKTPKTEPSVIKPSEEVEELSFDKAPVQSQQRKPQTDLNKTNDNKVILGSLTVSTTENVLTISQPQPLTSAKVSDFEPDAPTISKPEKTKKLKDSREPADLQPAPPLEEAKLAEKERKDRRGSDTAKQPALEPVAAVSTNADTEASKKSEPAQPAKLIRSSFRSSSGRKSKTSVEEKKRPKSSNEEANIDQLSKTAFTSDRASLTVSKSKVPVDTNGDSFTKTPQESDHRSQKFKKESKNIKSNRTAEAEVVELVHIEDNIERVDIYAKNSRGYQSGKHAPVPAKEEQGKETIVSQPQLMRSTDQQKQQSSQAVPELVAYAAPSFSSKQSIRSQATETPVDLPCVEVSSMQNRPKRLSGSSVSPVRTPTPPPVETPAASKSAEVEEKPKKSRRSKKEKPKVLHFSNRRRSPEPNKAEEEIGVDTDEELGLEGAQAEGRIDRWVENTNKHLLSDSSRPTISGRILADTPKLNDAPQSQRPDYQRQETGGFAIADTAPETAPPAVSNDSFVVRPGAISPDAFDQESLVVASDLSDPGSDNQLAPLGTAAGDTALAPAKADLQEDFDSESDLDDTPEEDEDYEVEDDKPAQDLPVMRPLSWEPISIVHPPTGLGASATLPQPSTQPPLPPTPPQQQQQQPVPPKKPLSTTLPVGTAQDITQGALDFMLNCLASKPILLPGDIDSSDVAPSRLLTNPYRRQAAEQAKLPQPPLIAEPLPLDADERRRYQRGREAKKAASSRRRNHRLGSGGGGTGTGGGGGPGGGPSRSASYYRSSSALSGRELSFTALSPAVMRRQSKRRSRSRSPETAAGRSKSFTGIAGAPSSDTLVGGAKSDGEEVGEDDYYEEDDDDNLRSATFDTRRREWTWFASNGDFVGGPNSAATAGANHGVDPRLRSRSMPIPTSADYNELAVQVDQATKRGKRRRRRRLPPATSNFIYETSV